MYLLKIKLKLRINDYLLVRVMKFYYHILFLIISDYTAAFAN